MARKCHGYTDTNRDCGACPWTVMDAQAYGVLCSLEPQGGENKEEECKADSEVPKH